MDAINEFFGGMPNRPDHRDFWRLAEQVMKLDARATDSDQGIDDLMDEVVDPNSLSYLAFQRAIRAVGAETQRDVKAMERSIVRLASVYVEAFIMGVWFQAEEEKADG